MINFVLNSASFMGMVNFGFNLVSLLGFAQILGALAYLVISIIQIINASNSRSTNDMTIRVLQLIFAPGLLLLSGIILVWQGWRFDPIMQVQQFLISILVVYLIIQDLRNRR